MIVNSLIMPALLFVTVIASVGLGILSAYAVVFGILSTFGRPAKPEPAPARPRLILIPTQHHASGD